MKINDFLASVGRSRAQLILIVIFWTLNYGLVTLRSWLAGAEMTWVIHGTRVLLMAAGGLICYTIYHLINLRRDKPFWQRAVIQWCSALPAALLFELALEAIYARAGVTNIWVSLTAGGLSNAALRGSLINAIEWLPVFVGWSGMSFGLAYHFEVRERERRISQLQTLAHEAQMRALRYQINPHFLFNTLNVVNSMILTGQNDAAEVMVGDLASFFRASLATDPTEDVALDQEIELQRLYLSLEQVRFPRRLQVDIDVPADLGNAKVPSLILQPLVENAIKYAVSRSPTRTRLRIAAARRDGWLELLVEDDGANAARAPVAGGTGIGLRNVRARLESRYGDQYRFAAGPRPEGGFAVCFAVPMETI